MLQVTCWVNEVWCSCCAKRLTVNIFKQLFNKVFVILRFFDPQEILNCHKQFPCIFLNVIRRASDMRIFHQGPTLKSVKTVSFFFPNFDWFFSQNSLQQLPCISKDFISCFIISSLMRRRGKMNFSLSTKDTKV